MKCIDRKLYMKMYASNNGMSVFSLTNFEHVDREFPN